MSVARLLTGLPRRLAMAAAFSCLGLADAAAADGKASTMDFVQSLGERVVRELTSPEVSDSERVKRLRRILTESFDAPAVGRFVLGPYYRRASEAQFREFLKLYEIYVAHNYAGLFKKYDGEKIRFSRERELGDGSVVVYGEIIQTSGPPVNTEIRVHRADGGYKALDIKVEGVSMPLTHRKQFASVINQRGGQVQGLIDALRAVTARFEAETPSE